MSCVVYVINSFDRGGAEAGLIQMVRGGVFAGCRLIIVGLVRGTGGLEKRLGELGQPPQILLDVPRMREKHMPLILFRLWKLLRQCAPDVVIASLPQANLLARLSLLSSRRTTFVSFEHNTHLAKRAYEIGYRLTSRRVDWVFADAETTLRHALARLYRSMPRMQRVVPLVSFARDGAAADRTEAGRFRVVNAARFTSVKNQVALVEAAAILRKAGRDVVMSLYGEGPELAACRTRAQELGVADRIEFPGFAPDWASRRADLFVLSSHHEGLCLVVLEAMQAGIPVAAPVIGGLQDYASDQTVQVISDVQPQTLADSIIVAMEDREALRSRAAAAARMVEARYGETVVRRVYREINELLIRSSALASGPLVASDLDGSDSKAGFDAR